MNPWSFQRIMDNSEEGEIKNMLKEEAVAKLKFCNSNR
jgi:hypothetical protein